MNAIAHRSMVVSLIEAACNRFDVKFEKSLPELRDIYTRAGYDDLANICFFGVGVAENRYAEAQRKDEFIDACKKIGLL